MSAGRPAGDQKAQALRPGPGMLTTNGGWT